MSTEDLDETGLQLLHEAGVGKLADIQINKDDIVTIAVARREQELLSRRAELEEEIARLRSENDALDTALEAGIEAQVQTLSGNFNDALTALLTCGFKGPKLELEHSWDETKKDGVVISVVASISCGAQKDQYGREQAASISTTQKLKVDAEGLARIRDRKKRAASIEQAEKELLSIRRDLGQLSSLERQAKAQVAIQLLGNSKAGQNLLKMMDKTSSKLLTVKK